MWRLANRTTKKPKTFFIRFIIIVAPHIRTLPTGSPMNFRTNWFYDEFIDMCRFGIAFRYERSFFLCSPSPLSSSNSIRITFTCIHLVDRFGMRPSWNRGTEKKENIVEESKPEIRIATSLAVSWCMVLLLLLLSILKAFAFEFIIKCQNSL